MRNLFSKLLGLESLLMQFSMFCRTRPFSRSLINSSVKADDEIGELKMEKRVTWAPFHRLRCPIWLDVAVAVTGNAMGWPCILPIISWARGRSATCFYIA